MQKINYSSKNFGLKRYLPLPMPLTASAISKSTSFFRSVDAGVTVISKTSNTSERLKNFSNPNSLNSFIAFVAVFLVNPEAINLSIYCFLSPIYCFYGSIYCFSAPLICKVLFFSGFFSPSKRFLKNSSRYSVVS